MIYSFLKKFVDLLIQILFYYLLLLLYLKNYLYPYNNNLFLMLQTLFFVKVSVDNLHHLRMDMEYIQQLVDFYYPYLFRLY